MWVKIKIKDISDKNANSRDDKCFIWNKNSPGKGNKEWEITEKKKINKLENNNINHKHKKKLKIIIVTCRLIISDLIYLQLEPKKKGVCKKIWKILISEKNL